MPRRQNSRLEDHIVELGDSVGSSATTEGIEIVADLPKNSEIGTGSVVLFVLHFLLNRWVRENLPDHFSV